MKKVLLFLVIGIFVLTGCGQEERVTGYGDPNAHWAPIWGYTEEQSDAIKQELASRIVYNPPSGDVGTVELWLDQIHEGAYLGTLIFNKEFWEKGYEFAGIDTERHIEALERDGRQWLSVTVRALFKQGENTFTYNDSVLELMIPVTVSENGRVELGEFFANTYHASSANPREDLKVLGYNRKAINLQMADVTHDGTSDYIMTTIWVHPEAVAETPDEMLINAGVGFVEVYDGRTDYNPENTNANPIWEEQFSASRPGNTQVSIVHRDDKDYLLLSDIGAMQGSYYFQYKVISLDNLGREYVEEKENINFDNHKEEDQRLNDAQKQEVQMFKEQIMAWLEGASLVVATDVSDIKQFVSTPEMTYRPEEYYDIIWPIYLGGME